MELSIIIPAYNEAERIGKTLKSFDWFLRQKSWHYEMLVVDDGSTDNTIACVEHLKAEVKNLHVLPSETNLGKGHAVGLGMLSANGEVRVFSDADGSTPIEELDKLLAPLQNKEADVSIGSRYLENSEIDIPQPLFRRAWSRLANRVVQNILLPGIVDPHCGFKAFTSAAAEHVFAHCRVNEWSFDLEVLALARKEKLRIAEVPVTWMNDENSKGKLRHMPKEVVNLYRIKKRVSSPNKVNA